MSANFYTRIVQLKEKCVYILYVKILSDNFFRQNIPITSTAYLVFLI